MRTRAITTFVALTFLLALVAPEISVAAEWEFSPTRMDLLSRLEADAESDLDVEETGTAEVLGKKNIGRALMFSIVLPGAGQLYAGPWWRALPWVAIEAVGWGVFATYNKKGNDKTDEFEGFADVHFSRSRYQAAEDSIKDLNGGVLPDNFTHELPPNNTQQYYEMIGKYLLQFGYGWDDAVNDDPDGPTLFFDGTTANFYNYADMRGEANDLLNTANIGMEVVMVNHIISALEAVFLVRQHNKRIESASDLGHHLFYERKQINGADTRMLTLRIPLK